MKKALSFAVVGGFILAAGCGIKSKTDQESLETLVYGSGWFGTRSAAGQGGAQALGDTIAPGDWWYRDATSFPTPNLDISVFDDSAYVHLYGQIGGDFFFYDSTNAWDWKTKPYTDNFTIEGIFQRLGERKHDNGWVLTYISGVHVNSTSNTTVVDSIVLTVTGSQNVVLTVTDPAAMYELASTMELLPGDNLNVKAYTSGDPGLAFLHIIGDGGVYERNAMADMGGGLFELADAVPQGSQGLQFAVVDLLDWNTINVIPAAYNVDLWFVPYRIAS